jgi:hypothetical protein
VEAARQVFIERAQGHAPAVEPAGPLAGAGGKAGF